MPLLLVREPAILLIKWLRPKGLKVCSYVENYAELKNQILKKSAGTQKCYARLIWAMWKYMVTMAALLCNSYR